jgi:signal transduction histidine kinase/CheY-like chemotaxis protein
MWRIRPAAAALVLASACMLHAVAPGLLVAQGAGQFGATSRGGGGSGWSSAEAALARSTFISAATLQQGALPLAGSWSFSLGDQPEFAEPDFFDAVWGMLSPGEPLPQGMVQRILDQEASGAPAIGWLRLRLSIDPELVGRPVAIHFGNSGAAELFLDGRHVATLGDMDVPGASAAILRRSAPIPVVFQSQAAVLAVRMHLGSAVSMRRSTPDRDLFQVAVASGDAFELHAAGVRRQARVAQAIFGIFAALALLHLVLFAFLRHPIGNVYFAAFAGCFSLFALLGQLAAGEPDLRAASLLARLSVAAAGVSLLALIAFLQATFYDRLLRTFRVLAVLTVLWVALSFVPGSDYANNTIWGIVAVFVLEGTRVIALAVLRQRDGAYIIGTGFVLTFAILAYLALEAFGLVPSSGDLFWYGWLGIALSSSIYLARNFARTSQGFEALSGHLEEQVEQRTAELAEAKVAAEVANRTKSQFLANMSHELRTPLNAIIGYSEMIAEEAADSGDTQYAADLNKIHSSGKHLLGLINDILDLSKVESGRMELYLESFDVRALVDEVAATVQPLVEKKSNSLDVRVAAGVATMRADQVKVRQILLNLLSNASKFTENGMIALTVEAGGTAEAGELMFVVRDSGIGMTPEQMGRLFQAFAQADAGTSAKFGGTGLGLAITRHFCELMGGSVSVESEPGLGTAFTVTLPRDVAPAPAAEVPRHRAAAEPGAATVLVVDDDAGTREMLERMLAKEHYRVVSAAGGDEGLRLARELLPDVITLDVMMAGTDGWTVLARLKADPATAAIPVVMLTITDDRSLGFALGAADYLTKPVDRERLADVLARVQAEGRQGPVLVVDDDAGVREMLRRTLEKSNWKVVEAAHGREALERLVEGPAVVLLDLMMPEMDGFEFLEELRSRPDGRDLPVVVLTAMTLTSADRDRLQSSVTRVLQKGDVSGSGILLELRRVLERQPATVNAVPTHPAAG